MRVKRSFLIRDTSRFLISAATRRSCPGRSPTLAARHPVKVQVTVPQGETVTRRLHWPTVTISDQQPATFRVRVRPRPGRRGPAATPGHGDSTCDSDRPARRGPGRNRDSWPGRATMTCPGPASLRLRGSARHCGLEARSGSRLSLAAHRAVTDSSLVTRNLKPWDPRPP